MANAWSRDRAGTFYIGFGLVALSAVAVGFSTTYYLPLVRRTFAAPPIVHLHGSLCLAWVLLFIWQTMLIRTQRTSAHRRVGQAGLPIALGILITGMGTAAWATGRDLGTLPTAYTNMIGTLTSLTIFAAFVLLAVLMRRRPDWHKRLMVLATVVVLWPAFFRFRHLMPWVPRPDIWLALVLADLPIIVAAVRDRVIYGQVHRAWAIFGTALILEQSFEIVMFETPFWSELGKAIYEFTT